ncbi:MAG: thiol reductant ABC exporter subunit CydD [Solirubrobacterales bacterium]
MSEAPPRSARSSVDRRLLRSVRAARLPFAAAVVLGVLTAVLVVAQASLLGRVIAGAFPGGEDLAGSAPLLWLLAGVIVLRALCAGGFEASGRVGAGRVMSELRSRITTHLLHARPTGLREQRSGELVTTAVQGVDALEAYFARYLPQLVLAVLVPVVLLAWIFPRDFAAGMILLVTLPVIVVFMVLIGLGARAATDRRWRTLTLLSAHFLDVVRGLETLRANDRAQAQVETLARAGDEYRRETMATLRIAFLSSLVLELAAMLGTALVAATIAIQLIGGNLSFSTGLAVLILAPELYLPIRMVGQQFHASADGLAAAERCFEALDAPATVIAPRSPVPAPDPSREALVLDEVVFSYPERDVPVLEGLSLRVEPGERLALVGPSGVGKSTVAAVLLRLLEPAAGKITCGGTDLAAVDPEAWRRRVAWVPQRTTLFSGTLADNVSFADPSASPEALTEACRAAGLDRVAATLPAGLETPVGEAGRRLSAGEAQRVALARAFLRDAPLLVLDEPTAHLDAEASAQVGEAIEHLAAGRTTLMIVHRPALARGADRVIELRGNA